jgi:small-conductance mechanosensitive channel
MPSLQINNLLIKNGIDPEQVEWQELEDQMRHPRTMMWGRTDEEIVEFIYFTDWPDVVRKKIPMKGGIPYFVRKQVIPYLICALIMVAFLYGVVIGSAILFLALGAIGARLGFKDPR